jgi:hypothetical protein
LQARTDNRDAVVLPKTQVEMTPFRISQERLPGSPGIVYNWPILILGVAHQHVQACRSNLHASSVVAAASGFPPLKISNIQIA